VQPQQRTPALSFSPELLLRAQEIRLVIFDVDGVLTDGGLYFSEAGESLKQFSVLDGQGFALLQRAGISIAIITGRDSAALRTRLNALKVQHEVYGVQDKLPAAEQLIKTLGFTWQQVAVIGDDWPDLPLLVRAHLACAPANAHVENKALVHHVTQARGGQGAARELCDLILVAQGHYTRYFEEAVQ
jgi:3-deoxy-D-manno-octulosonate 8-phosphate phosphatase (KDO 8-P phosphatase)